MTNLRTVAKAKQPRSNQIIVCLLVCFNYILKKSNCEAWPFLNLLGVAQDKLTGAESAKDSVVLKPKCPGNGYNRGQ